MTWSLKHSARAVAVFVTSFLCSVFVCFSQVSPAPPKVADSDLVLINGKIITVDAHDSVTQAIAIHDGKIVAVGTNEEIRKLSSKGARVIDLHGRTATPGLIDTHCHFDATDELYAINLSSVRSV